MTTSFSSLPLVSLSTLSDSNPTPEALISLSKQLDDVFSTTGFAYLTDLPLTYTHDDVFSLCDNIFGPSGLSDADKQETAKKTFVKTNKNTYRGYFPPQAGSDNLKEGWELGTPSTHNSPTPGKFNLTEPNVWPSSECSEALRTKCETLHTELQALSVKLLKLLAIALGKSSSFFDDYLVDSLSTLRLLHYPPPPVMRNGKSETVQELICTPHTDSGILTLLHQDQTGGLEVRNSDGSWIPAPYVPGSMVVNIGDLMSHVSNGRWVATFHRVRSSPPTPGGRNGMPGIGRYSVPFFFEPGRDCVVKSVVEGENDEGVLYGKHVLEKMSGWVEFQDVEEESMDTIVAPAMIEAY